GWWGCGCRTSTRRYGATRCSTPRAGRCCGATRAARWRRSTWPIARGGWGGPRAVRPDRQGAGIGKLIVRAAVDWLAARGVTTLGLETMPRTVENIGFYARLGFVPGHLTVTVTNDIAARGHPAPSLLSQRAGPAGAAALEAARRLVADLAPGYDFTREILLTAELELGDTVLVDGDDG